MEARRESLPVAFVERMRLLLGGEAEEFFAAYEEPGHTGLRVNLLKISAHQFGSRSPWPLQPVPWCPSGFSLGEGARAGKHPYHAAGLYYIQEPSAMAVAEALQIEPGHRVLDLAAAPGGKSTHIAALLKGEGLLVANEVEGSRVKALGENLERWGARNVLITNDTPERLADQFPAMFDRVLLDAPCSGEGMFRKTPVARAEWSVAHVKGSAMRQGRIMEQAARLVAPGGLLLYSTCTFAPEENEERIGAFLAEHDGWDLVAIPKRPGFSPARPEWAGPAFVAELERAVRLWPHHVAGEGHFMALLRNRAQAPETPCDPASARRDSRRERRQSHGARAPEPRIAEPAGNALAAWQEFESRSLARSFAPERLLRKGEQLYLTPEGAPPGAELRIVRPGLPLGTLKTNRFEPAHALALALRSGEARMVEELDGRAIERYLQGQTLQIAGPDGWLVLTIEQWPIGWGRRIGDVIKNFYPKGLRRPDSGRS